MEVGGIDWPVGVTMTKRLIHSVHDILLSVCPPWAGNARGAASLDSQRVKIIYMSHMQKLSGLS